MTWWALYDTATGVIRWTVSTVQDDVSFAAEYPSPPGTALALIGDDSLSDSQYFYVDDGDVLERTAISPIVSKTTILADGVDTSVINNLPDPCTVTVSGPMNATATVTGGELVFSVEQAGSWLLTFKKEPTHNPYEVTIVST